MPEAPSARRPELSVVLSTIGNYQVLERVLDGYSRQDAPPGSFEVLVVTDVADPEPQRVEQAIGERAFPVRRLTGHAPGLSANRNTGWGVAGAPIVLFTDNDTIPGRRLVSEHLAWHRRHPEHEVGVVGLVRWAPEVRVTTFMRWLDDGVQFDYPNIRGTEAGWGRFYGANASVKRALLDRVGGFNETELPYGYEDLDWAYRASQHGLRLLYARRAVVEHLRHDMTLEFWKRRMRRIAVAERQFVRLHPEIPPWFHTRFTSAARQPRPRGRAVRIARYVPRRTPWLGPRVWRAVDLTFRQALAPDFLEAWYEAENRGAGPLQPDLSELEASSAGSASGGPK